MISAIYGKETPSEGYTGAWTKETPPRESSPVKIRITDPREKIFFGEEIIPAERDMPKKSPPMLGDRERIVKNVLKGSHDLKAPVQPKKPPPPSAVWKALSAMPADT